MFYVELLGLLIWAIDLCFVVFRLDGVGVGFVCVFTVLDLCVCLCLWCWVLLCRLGGGVLTCCDFYGLICVDLLCLLGVCLLCLGDFGLDGLVISSPVCVGFACYVMFSL